MADQHPAVEHIVLYAKGHYLHGLSTMEDLRKMFTALKQPADPESIVSVVAEVALTAIRRAQASHRITEPTGSKKPDGKKAVEEAKKSVTPLTEYLEQMLFMYRAVDSMLDQYGPTSDDFQEDVVAKTKVTILELVIQAMLVVIARWNVSEEEIGDPSKKILPLTSPEKYKEKKNETY